MRISLCIIARNDEKFLDALLAAMADCVDEIIVVVDKSSAGTAGIAKKYADKVILHEWKQSFSEARNLSLAEATGDWILVLDADEIISPGDMEKLREIAKEDISAVSLLQCTYSDDLRNPHWIAADNMFTRKSGFKGCIVVPAIRFFRNRLGIRFSRRVHELVDDSLQELGLSSQIRQTDIPIHHLKYAKGGEYARRKEDLYMELSKKEMEDNPDNYKAYFDIGVVQLARKNFAAARKNFLKSLEINPSNPICLFNLGAVYAEMGEYEKAEDCYLKALALDPAPPVYKNLALVCCEAGKYVKALEFFEKYYKLTGDGKIMDLMNKIRGKISGS